MWKILLYLDVWCFFPMWWPLMGRPSMWFSQNSLCPPQKEGLVRTVCINKPINRTDIFLKNKADTSAKRKQTSSAASDWHHWVGECKHCFLISYQTELAAHEKFLNGLIYLDYLACGSHLKNILFKSVYCIYGQYGFCARPVLSLMRFMTKYIILVQIYSVCMYILAPLKNKPRNNLTSPVSVSLFVPTNNSALFMQCNNHSPNQDSEEFVRAAGHHVSIKNEIPCGGSRTRLKWKPLSTPLCPRWRSVIVFPRTGRTRRNLWWKQAHV